MLPIPGEILTISIILMILKVIIDKLNKKSIKKKNPFPEFYLIYSPKGFREPLSGCDRIPLGVVKLSVY